MHTRTMRLGRGLLTLAVVAGTVGVVLPSPAQATTAAPVPAGSIVYVKSANVWIARPDGSGARRLTSDGTATSPYRSPSEDDAGHVVALRGTKLYRLDQFGHLLQAFTPPNAGLAVDFARVSPDGRAVAYSFQSMYTDCSFSPCHTLFEHTLAYTSATRATLLAGTATPGDAMWASWIGNSRVVIGGHTSPNQVRYQDLGAAQPRLWYSDCDSVSHPCSGAAPDTTYYDTFPAVARGGDRYATVVMVVGGTANVPTYLVLSSTSAAATATPPATPAIDCVLPGSDSTGPYPGQWQASIQTPSWSPDGRALVTAFRNAAGAWQVWRIDVGADLGACDSYGGGPVVDGGTQPYWSAAPLTRATTTRLTLSSDPSVHGSPVTLTARVAGSATGSVRFLDGTRVLHRSAVQGGTATFRTASLAAGIHQLRAVFAGSSTAAASSSTPVRLTVQPTRPPAHWRFVAVPVAVLRATTLHAQRAVDVRVRGVAHVPATARGVLLRLTLAHATTRTGVAVCPKPRSGSGVPGGCWSLAARPGSTRSGYVIVAAGDRSRVRLYDRAGSVRASLAVLGYYR